MKRLAAEVATVGRRTRKARCTCVKRRRRRICAVAVQRRKRKRRKLASRSYRPGLSGETNSLLRRSGDVDGRRTFVVRAVLQIFGLSGASAIAGGELSDG
jgi:hypothetical protein